MAVCYRCGRNKARHVVYTPIMHFEFFLCDECYAKYKEGGGVNGDQV